MATFASAVADAQNLPIDSALDAEPDWPCRWPDSPRRLGAPICVPGNRRLADRAAASRIAGPSAPVDGLTLALRRRSASRPISICCSAPTGTYTHSVGAVARRRPGRRGVAGARAHARRSRASRWRAPPRTARTCCSTGSATTAASAVRHPGAVAVHRRATSCRRCDWFPPIERRYWLPDSGPPTCARSRAEIAACCRGRAA